MYFIKKPKTLKHKLRAVSPVVATLVLIVVAIVGAIAVGLIMSRVASDTGNQANVGNVANGAQTQLTIGGSTTVYPLDQAAIPAFEAQYHVNVQDAQGGSDAGMQGVISGSLNIGAASSASAVNNAENDVLSNSITGVTITPALIGGSAVVVIENGAAPGGFLADQAGNACQGITRAALAAVFELPGATGAWGIIGAACAPAPAVTFGTLDQSAVTPSTTICAKVLTVIGAITYPACTGVGDTGAVYQSVSRSDNSGTQDQFASYTGLAKQSTGGNYPGNTESGNPGVLNYVNTHAGSIGFVDLGFAEGAASGAVCPAGHVAGNTCGVSMPQVDTATPTAAPTNAVTNVPATGTNGYVSINLSAANIHNLIVAALKLAAHTNPLTLAGQVASYPDSASPGTGLARTFYLVTNGTPNPVEEQFINFMTNPNSESYYTANGYFSQYDITSA